MTSSFNETCTSAHLECRGQLCPTPVALVSLSRLLLQVSKLEELRGVAQFAGLHALCADQRISGLATQLLGEQAELMKDKFIFKAAGQGMPFTPHQDMQYIYHRVVTDAVNFYVAFDDANEENGALQVVKGLERCLHGRLIADPTEEKIRDDVAAMMHFEPVALCKGDVLAFSGWVPHRSGPNLSSRHRSVYYPTYGIWPGPRGKLYETYYEAYWQWVRGNTVSNRHGSVDKLFEAYGNPRPSLVTGPVVDLSVELARLG